MLLQGPDQQELNLWLHVEGGVALCPGACRGLPVDHSTGFGEFLPIPICRDIECGLHDLFKVGLCTKIKVTGHNVCVLL